MKPRNRQSADFFAGPRRAVVDIGSNTVRLVIFGGSRRAPTPLWNEKVAARLGKDLPESGRLGEDSQQLALQGLARYSVLLRSLDIDDVETVATAAARDAENGPEFLEKVRELGLSPRLLSGEEEAMIGAMGVLSAFPEAEGTVADLGGGSLELTEIGPLGSSNAVSLPLGTLRLASMQAAGPEKFAQRITKSLKKAGWDHATDKPLYMVGGSFRSMATYSLRSSAGVLDDPHGLAMDAEQAGKLAKELTKASPDDLRKINGISSMRAAALPHVAWLVRVLLTELRPSQLVFSSWGLREGLLYQRLDPVARMQDPLLAGIAAFCTPRGGSPDIAVRIAGWTVEAARYEQAGTERLRLAAIMLALASMQIEPNLRAHQAMGWALHKRWLNLDAPGRAMMAATALANCGTIDLPPELKELATEKQLRDAVSWGLALRLCRRLGANSLPAFEGTALSVQSGKLTLSLAEPMAPLIGRGTEKDLGRLADCLELEPVIQTVSEEELHQRRYSLSDGIELPRIPNET